MKFFKFWFPPLVYSGMIFCVSSLSFVQSPVKVEYFDKLLHMAEYAPLGFLLARALSRGNGMLSRTRNFGLAVFMVFLYGLSDEYHQSFVAGREATVFDALADTIGGMLGAYGYSVLRLRLMTNKERLNVEHQTL